jgi:hypothetical protein
LTPFIKNSLQAIDVVGSYHTQIYEPEHQSERGNLKTSLR